MGSQEDTCSSVKVSPAESWCEHHYLSLIKVLEPLSSHLMSSIITLKTQSHRGAVSSVNLAFMLLLSGIKQREKPWKSHAKLGIKPTTARSIYTKGTPRNTNLNIELSGMKRGMKRLRFQPVLVFSWFPTWCMISDSGSWSE